MLMKIGLTGSIGAGKGVVAEYFKAQGFDVFSLSDEVREVARRKGVEINRANLQDLGNKLRETIGDDVLARFVALRVLSKGGEDAVIDSIRNPAEIEYLRENLNDFYLIGVDAPVEVRYKRVVERARESDPVSLEDFLKIDSRDKGEGESSSGQAVGRCLGMADYSVSNEGCLDEFNEKIYGLHQDIKSKIPRPSWDDYFMDIAKAVAKRATCDRGRSGCVVVKDKQILVTGYVGSPPGFPHCDEVGHQMKTVTHEDGRQTQHCVRTTHAEQNAIAQAARLGVPLDGSILYCRMTPCATCARLIITSGVERVVCEKKYHAGAESEEMFETAKIPIVFMDNEVQRYRGQ